MNFSKEEAEAVRKMKHDYEDYARETGLPAYKSTFNKVVFEEVSRHRLGQPSLVTKLIGRK